MTCSVYHKHRPSHCWNDLLCVLQISLVVIVEMTTICWNQNTEQVIVRMTAGHCYNDILCVSQTQTQSLLEWSALCTTNQPDGYCWNDYYMLKSQHRASHCCNDRRSLLQWPALCITNTDPVIFGMTWSILQINPVVIVTITSGHSWNDHNMLKSQHRAGHCCNNRWSLLQWPVLCITNTDPVIFRMICSMIIPTMTCYILQISPVIIVTMTSGHSWNDYYILKSQHRAGHCWNITPWHCNYDHWLL